MYSDDSDSDLEGKVRARKVDSGGNPWVLGGTSNVLDQRVPPPRARFRKAIDGGDGSLPGSKFEPGVIPQVRGGLQGLCPLAIKT
jgi:hypothetical protein